MGKGIESRQECRVLGQGPAAVGHRVGAAHTALGQPVEVGRHRASVAIAAEMVRTRGIKSDQEYVGPR